jgi:phage shock protein E
MGLRRQLLGEPNNEEIARLVREGATILDIRTPAEFEQGHVEDALHIPLDELLQSLPMIPKDRPIVTCNADDALSATAAEMLQAHGFKAFDGGGWSRLRDLLKHDQ